jgi:hypothetical protein
LVKKGGMWKMEFQKGGMDSKNMNLNVAKYIADNDVKPVTIYLPTSLIKDLDNFRKDKFNTRNKFILMAILEKLCKEE